MNMEQEEIWINVPSLEGYCQASNFGRIKTNDRIVPRKHLHPNFTKGRILKYSINRCGYVYYRVVVNGKKTMLFPHRLVAILFVENKNNKPEVNHKDGNKLNNHFDNLEWCTRKENMTHAFVNGLHNLNGENSHRAKLTNSDVLKARELFDCGKMSIPQLAKLYNINQSGMRQAVKRQTWKHI